MITNVNKQVTSNLEHFLSLWGAILLLSSHNFFFVALNIFDNLFKKIGNKYKKTGNIKFLKFLCPWEGVSNLEVYPSALILLTI